jgi:hypothetical protein
MKYTQIRIGLLTFVLGIVSIPFFNALYYKSNEPLVNVPEVASGTAIVVSIENEKRSWHRG